MTKRIVAAVALTCLVLGVGAFFLVTRVILPSDPCAGSSQATALMERLSKDPASAEDYFDPGLSGGNMVAGYLATQGKTGTLASDKSSSLGGVPSCSSLGAALVTATGSKTPPDDAARRIVAELIDSLGDPNHGLGGHVPSALQPYVSSIFATYISFGYGDAAMAGGNGMIHVEPALAPVNETDFVLLAGDLARDEGQYSQLIAAESSELDAYLTSTTDEVSTLNFRVNEAGEVFGVMEQGRLEATTEQDQRGPAISQIDAARGKAIPLITTNPHLNSDKYSIASDADVTMSDALVNGEQQLTQAQALS